MKEHITKHMLRAIYVVAETHDMSEKLMPSSIDTSLPMTRLSQNNNLFGVQKSLLEFTEAITITNMQLTLCNHKLLFVSLSLPS